MDAATLKRLGKQVGAEVKADNVGLLASAVAFRIFLSIFPSLIAVVGVFSLVTSPSDITGLINEARGVLPSEAQGFLERTLTRMVAEGSGGGFAIAGVLGGLWAASSAAAVLIKALNAAYEVAESRGFVKQRLVALLLTGVLLLAIFGLLALLVVGRFLQAWLVPDSLQGPVVDTVFLLGRVAGAVLLMMVLFAVVYRVGPNRGRAAPFEWVTPGAVLAVLAWLALSALFALYTRAFGSYGATYGSLAGAVVMMLWLQLTMTTLLVGAELNQVWRRHTRARDGAGSRVEPD